ncbi:phosphoglycerate dehydrogenase-like enzyme [Conyzicola lurida]|uniref:Phosphoglycerate dehydrogenase-like enzyme n=1 Tax=Conyzicola lurida TaxID=1172621 RepID=A0A841AM01_9MICO|nr:D-isomer specific 2-hydroxyacid dehydrogenase family protein [Conyzicola lurida]MBB5843374.1 phosphoglycerate dehydrogenase-like enzyme [Conyzicola lurida]
MTRAPGQHRDPAGSDAVPVAADRRPTAGPVAILPHDKKEFADAVIAAGGTVGPLSDETRGVVWLVASRPDELTDILDSHPGIEWVQLPWAGVDAFSGLLAGYADRPLPLWTSAKGAYSEPVAEHALALTLALLRGLPEKARATSWATTEIGQSLFGMNVVIVGAGGIAVEIMRLLSVFDTTVTVVRRTATPLAGADRTVAASELLEVLPHADVVILAAASTTETKHLLGAAEFAAMKPSAVLVNIARGALIDTDALVEALAAGEIDGAALDVTDPEPLPDGHPLWTEPRCIITSHSADTKAMTAPLLAGRIEVNVTALLGDGRFVGVVDTAAGY